MTTDTTAPVVKVEFERDTCTRCGGTGEYPSSCWGGACIACHRKGVVLTRRGKAAVRKMEAWQAANMSTGQAWTVELLTRCYDEALARMSGAIATRQDVA